MIKVNEYEEGQVKSLGFESDGLPCTVGVVLPGQYIFSTEKNESLTITVGWLEFRLPNEDWQGLKVGQKIDIPAGFSFDLRADKPGSYVCVYK